MAPLPFGWTGKVLHINLSTRTFSTMQPDTDTYARFLGGRGLAGYFLRPHCTRHATDPDLPICLFTGPLTATATPTSGRGTLMTRSPLTGGICVCSVGGKLATQLKRSGWDGVVIDGIAAKPSGIEIQDSTVRITETTLWGKETGEVFTRLSRPDNSVATVGPAAEYGSPMASVAVDRHHAAARGGPGLVWAAKNLKYLCISATGSVPVHDPEALATAREDILRLTAASPALLGQQGFTHRGTGALYDLIDSRCMMPTDNFKHTRFERAPGLNATAYETAYAPSSHGCAGCHIRCKRVAADGRTIPDYDAMAHWTALIGNNELEQAMLAETRCRELGLDPISTAAALACLREITGEDFNRNSLSDALDDAASGGIVGQGSVALALAHGHPETAMAVKGLGLPAYDPRGACGMALAYAVSTRGGCHRHAFPLSHEILRKPVATDRFSFSGKARIIKLAEDAHAVADAFATCRYLSLAAGMEESAKAFTAVTGESLSGQTLMTIGERICLNERLMNTANDFTHEDDDLPHRFFSEPGTAGPGFATPPLDRAAFLEARTNYYRVRGLDDHGHPTPQTIQRLGLEEES